jgi:hypothetical protein
MIGPGPEPVKQLWRTAPVNDASVTENSFTQLGNSTVVLDNMQPELYVTVMEGDDMETHVLY